jgi:hypothetical protein
LSNLHKRETGDPLFKKKYMAAIKKNSFESIRKKFSKEAEYKPERFLDLGDAFLDASGIPGPAIGHLNMLLGHSDTGKTTALVKSAVDAQKKGILPVLIITEQKWNWEHAELMGFDRSEDFYLFNSDFEYIEQITDYINELLDAQEKGDLPYDLLFLWDSVGSVPCKMTYEGKGGAQHNARILSDKIGQGLNQRISGSRRTDKKYTNTLVIVNQPWVELPDNPYGQPKIKAKGGEAIWLNSTLVFRFGNEKNAGTTKIAIQKDGRKVKIATRTKISIMKNHVNGLGYEDGRIMVTAHGFMGAKTESEEKKSIEEYKRDAGSYISEKLGVNVADTGVEVVTDDE